MQKNWYFVRHGQTDYNKMGIVQGSGVDSSLNKVGRAQAKAFYKHYKSIPFDKVITSALKRTHETMKHFIDDGLPWEQDAAINEMNWGIHEGQKSEPHMMKAYKVMIGSWAKGNIDARLPEGESAAELTARLHGFINGLRKRPEKHLLICTHGRSLRCLMMLLKKQATVEMEAYKHSNTGVFKVVFDGEDIVVERENCVLHLG